ncbi:protein kinase domain-containing protein [Sarocladium implicatum]|nr:protein kinase domain-containing protein [Sarocladium implicatum]
MEVSDTGAAQLATLTTIKSDLVRDSVLETVFLDQAIQHVSWIASHSGRRRVRAKETWHRVGELGRGAFGQVWLEQDVASRRRAKFRALKTIRKDKSSHVVDYARELEAAAKFSKERYLDLFVQSHGWFEDEKTIYISMEYLKHGDLENFLDEAIPEAGAQRIVSQLAEGLAEMHRHKFVHRDLKPKNILVVDPGPDWWVKIGDFGISKRAEEGSTICRTRIGTEGYCAPEVLRAPTVSEIRGEPSKRSYTASVDLWALGAITFRILAQRPVFRDPLEMARFVDGRESLETQMNMLRRNDTSDHCIVFVQNLIVVDPESRISADCALQHPWLQIEDPSGTASSSQSEASIAELKPKLLQNSTHFLDDASVFGKGSIEWTTAELNTVTGRIGNETSEYKTIDDSNTTIEVDEEPFPSGEAQDNGAVPSAADVPDALRDTNPDRGPRGRTRNRASLQARVESVSDEELTQGNCGETSLLSPVEPPSEASDEPSNVSEDGCDALELEELADVQMNSPGSQLSLFVGDHINTEHRAVWIRQGHWYKQPGARARVTVTERASLEDDDEEPRKIRAEKDPDGRYPKILARWLQAGGDQALTYPTQNPEQMNWFCCFVECAESTSTTGDGFRCFEDCRDHERRKHGWTMYDNEWYEGYYKIYFPSPLQNEIKTPVHQQTNQTRPATLRPSDEDGQHANPEPPAPPTPPRTPVHEYSLPPERRRYDFEADDDNPPRPPSRASSDWSYSYESESDPDNGQPQQTEMERNTWGRSRPSSTGATPFREYHPSPYRLGEQDPRRHAKAGASFPLNEPHMYLSRDGEIHNAENSRRRSSRRSPSGNEAINAWRQGVKPGAPKARV